MADKMEFDLDSGYQDTKTYASASPERRRQFNRYKRENSISDEHMFLLLFRDDLEAVPPEVRRQGETTTYVILIVGFLLLWYSLQSGWNGGNGANVTLIFMAVASFVGVAAVFYTGVLNPYKRAVREVNRRLKKMPEVPDFLEWDTNNPAKSQSKPNKSKKRRRRR